MFKKVLLVSGHASIDGMMLCLESLAIVMTSELIASGQWFNGNDQAEGRERVNPVHPSRSIN